MQITIFFWQNIKPLFSGKSKSQTNIILIEDDNVVSEKEHVAEILNTYFIEAVRNLEIEKFNNEGAQTPSENIDEVIENIVKKYELHPSILKIKENVKNKFQFEDTTEDELYLKIKYLVPFISGLKHITSL